MTRPNNPGLTPERPESTVIGTYEKYSDAQRLVDYLSDKGFAVEHVRIVGRGLHSVEQVVGRMTVGRAAAMGAASGAWLGLLFGLLLSLFTTTEWWRPIVVALVFGIVWGAILGAIGHWATRGQRDFASTQMMAAEQYEVEVDNAVAEDARNIAGQLKLALGES